MTTPTSAAEFDELSRTLPYPSLPKKPLLQRSDFGSNKDYHLAMAEAEDEHERELASVKESRRQYNERQNEITEEFWKWALTEAGIADLPEHVLQEVRSYAWGEGHSGGFSEIFNYLLRISDMVLMAYKVGKDAS